MSITNRNNLLQESAQYGMYMPYQCALPPATTAAAAGSGFHTVNLYFDISSTMPGTLVSIPFPASVSNSMIMLLNCFSGNGSGSRGIYLGWLYQIGTSDLTAIGNSWTHDAATFPVKRTQMGVSTAVNLVPILYVTTATSVVAPIFTLKNVLGTTGYVNQAGSTVVGTVTMTMPAAATVAQSAFICRLESGDSAIQDIQSVDVLTTGTTGAATLFGFEPMVNLSGLQPVLANIHDHVGTGLTVADMRPAVATSGTATAYLAILTLGTSAVFPSGSSAFWSAAQNV